MKIQTEEQLAEKAVALLESDGWTVYQEVKDGGSGRTVDIYGKRHNLFWAVEVKRSFTLKLIEQAAKWEGRANFISVAVPTYKSNFPAEVCRRFGIGVLEFFGADLWRENVRPKLHRHIHPLTTFPEQITYAKAGNNRRKSYTPYTGTRDRVIAFVTANPGCTLTQILDNINTHYGTLGTARSCILRDIQAGFKGYAQLEAVLDKGKYKFYPR